MVPSPAFTNNATRRLTRYRSQRPGEGVQFLNPVQPEYDLALLLGRVAHAPDAGHPFVFNVSHRFEQRLGRGRGCGTRRGVRETPLCPAHLPFRREPEMRPEWQIDQNNLGGAGHSCRNGTLAAEAFNHPRFLLDDFGMATIVQLGRGQLPSRLP